MSVDVKKGSTILLVISVQYAFIVKTGTQRMWSSGMLVKNVIACNMKIKQRNFVRVATILVCR